jgi:hypothetical protein
MSIITDVRTLAIMLSAFVLAVLCILPGTREIFPFWLIASGMHIAGTLFHELGHSLFFWLAGMPSIPMIFTLFGADQAGGMAMTFERSWLLQWLMFAALGGFCYWIRHHWERMFIPAVLFSLVVAALAFTPYYKVLPLFMGHGSAIVMGGFFLFRAWIYLDARNAFERWLNAFFGAFLVLYNMHFSYKLIAEDGALARYSEHVAFGIGHNDFVKITHILPVSVQGVAAIAICLCLAALVLSAWLAVLLRNDFPDSYETL